MLWSLVAAMSCGAHCFALEQVAEIGNLWASIVSLAAAASWFVKAVPFFSTPLAAADQERTVILGAPANSAGHRWLQRMARGISSRLDPREAGAVIPEWFAPETDIPDDWYDSGFGVRGVGTGPLFSTTAGHPGVRTVVELGEQERGIRWLSLWEAGAAMGTVPLA